MYRELMECVACEQTFATVHLDDTGICDACAKCKESERKLESISNELERL